VQKVSETEQAEEGGSQQMRTTRKLLYNKVSNAREHCCGCAPQDKTYLLKDVADALNFAFSVDAPQSLINKLVEAKKLIQKSKTFHERLSADQLLCEVLNVDLKEATKK